MKKKMKKKISIIVILLSLLLICGCDDEKPKSWDMDKENWKVWKIGVIESIIEIGDTDKDWEITFKGGTKYRVGNIKNPDSIEHGQEGTLYKNDLRSNDYWSWFHWVEKEKTSIEIKKPVVKAKPTVATKEIVISEWKNYDDIKELSANEIVLIKMTDGIITTGFITYDKKWKLGFNINQYEGGKTLVNVFKWKKINIE